MKAIYKVEQLHKGFGNNKVLRGLDLEIYEGQLLAIMGPSGCGKSVFVKHLVGLLQADSGKIFYKGEEVTNYSEKQWYKVRRQVSFLFQGGALFDYMTVFENIAFPLERILGLSYSKIREKVKWILKKLGLDGTENKMPSELSGGMRRRVALARALITEPEVLFLDEPTTGLDPVTTAYTDDLVMYMNKEFNTTMIVITHDMKSASRIADRVVLLWEGVVKFDGTIEDMKNSEDPLVVQFREGTSKGPIKIDV